MKKALILFILLLTVFYSYSQDSSRSKSQAQQSSYSGLLRSYGINKTAVEEQIENNPQIVQEAEQALGTGNTSELQSLANSVAPGLGSGILTPPSLTTQPKATTSTAPVTVNVTNGPTGLNPDSTALYHSPIDTSVYDTTGLKLRSTVYGQDFLRNRYIGVFNRTVDGEAPDNYIMGVGDKVNVVIWGYSNYNEVFTIDPTGSINPNETGRIYLKGLTFRDAKNVMRSRFGQYFDLKTSQIDFSVVYSRVITVNVVGEVNNPGSYSIPALNTAFNALIAANGTNQIGSVRKIYVKRDGKTVFTLDLYKFLQDPDAQSNFYLQDNDYIVVPPADKIVKITGYVKRPYKYELLEDENLSDLISYAGGFSMGALTKTVHLERYQNNEMVLSDIPYDSLKKLDKNFALEDGDNLNVDSIQTQILKYVKVTGDVKNQGQFQFTQGMRVSDLLAKAQGVRINSSLENAYVIRTNPDYSTQYLPVNLANVLKDVKSTDNFAVQNLDELHVFSNQTFASNTSVTVYGAVRTPGSIPFGTGLTLKDALYYAGGLTLDAANDRIEISRIITNSSKGGNIGTPVPVTIQTVQVGTDLSIDKTAEGFQLQPYDQIFVRQSSNFILQEDVNIDGEIKFPGKYTMTSKAERIADLLKQAGGPTQYAFLSDATLYRPSDNTGFVVFNMQQAIDDPKSKYNFLLKDGDVISIPTANEIVSITGAVGHPFLDSLKVINAPFEEGHRAKYYVKNFAGGFGDNAIRKQTYTIEAGGKVAKTWHFLFINRYPVVHEGTSIYVESEPISTTQAKSLPIDWTAVIEDITIKLTAVASLYFLLERVFNN
jgi:polysaccharide biosynthesis/export protein